MRSASAMASAAIVAMSSGVARTRAWPTPARTASVVSIGSTHVATVAGNGRSHSWPNPRARAVLVRSGSRSRTSAAMPVSQPDAIAVRRSRSPRPRGASMAAPATTAVGGQSTAASRALPAATSEIPVIGVSTSPGAYWPSKARLKPSTGREAAPAMPPSVRTATMATGSSTPSRADSMARWTSASNDVATGPDSLDWNSSMTSTTSPSPSTRTTVDRDAPTSRSSRARSSPCTPVGSPSGTPHSWICSAVGSATRPRTCTPKDEPVVVPSKSRRATPGRERSRGQTRAASSWDTETTG